LFGQSNVTFTATVSDNSGGSSGTPRNGTVQFETNGVNFGAPVIISGGRATSVALAKYLPVNGYTVTAVYSGDASFLASSGTLTQIVSQASSAVTVTSSSNPSLFGQSGVTFTATVSDNSGGSSGTPRNGTVQFYTNTVPFGAPVTISGGVANSIGLPKYAPAGGYVVPAVYTGDGNFLTSSGAFTQTINQASSAVTLASSSNTDRTRSSRGLCMNITPSMNCTRCSRQTASIRANSAALVSPGFSHNTCLPAWAARITHS